MCRTLNTGEWHGWETLWRLPSNGWDACPLPSNWDFWVPQLMQREKNSSAGVPGPALKETTAPTSNLFNLSPYLEKNTSSAPLPCSSTAQLVSIMDGRGGQIQWMGYSRRLLRASSNCLDTMRKHLLVKPDREVFMCVHVCVCVHTLCLS